ncbi:MAG: DUF503 domain-containing protein [Candidatus Aminicenantes bacterium]|nr:DUF503 domain-containing protein [Candidatus Aminicenantes bacterium]
MIIGCLILEIHIPFSHSLKEKRKRLIGCRDRLQKKYNVAFAELDYQDKWQRTKLGIVTLNSEKKIVESLLQKVLRDVEENVDGEILQSHIYFI